MKILLIDDEKNLRKSIMSYFSLEGIEVGEADNGLAGQRLLKSEHFDCVITDLRMPGLDGMELLQWLKEEGPTVPVIMISAFGEIEDAVGALRLGAHDYVVKPFDPDDLLIRAKRAVKEHTYRNLVDFKAFKTPLVEHDFEKTESAEVRKIIALAKKVASTNATILITGESGTGKEVLAKYIHGNSQRAAGPFIPINVGGIPDNLVESELFGYEKGAFTGAERRKPGIMELASSGSLFLDEIGEMPLHLQVKLLRVLQEKKIQRLGGTIILPVDLRFIAATNKNLGEMVATGSFREDLYYRLKVIVIDLPPLRDRREDIPLLIASFIDRFNKEQNKKIKGIDGGAVELLQNYRYPGNIRELENMVETAMVLAETEYLRARDFPVPKNDYSTPRGTLREVEKSAIKKALLRHEGHREATACELGITRRTLLNKIKEYHIEI